MGRTLDMSTEFSPDCVLFSEVGNNSKMARCGQLITWQKGMEAATSELD